MTTKKITYINNNDPVSAPVANTPIQELKRETDKLSSKLETAEAGNILVYRDIPCDPTGKIGMPVYWDGVAQCCKPAYVSTELNNLTQEYETGEPADCIGLIYRKNSEYSADIVIAGIVDFPEISAYLEGGTGRFYLGSSPGSLSLIPNAQAFPLGVVLGTLGPCDDAYRVYINPSYTNTLLQHQHYSVDLKPDNWEWFSVEDEHSPSNCYVYQLEDDEELSRLWPPIPLGAVSATVDWADDSESIGGKELTINKPSSLLQINEYGIYWMGADNPAIPAISNGFKQARITLHFSKVRYATRNAFVTSLRPDTNQPFKFVDCRGKESTAGELYAQFTLNQTVVKDTKYNGIALKQFTEDWKSEQTPVVNGLRINGNAVAIGTNDFNYEDNTYQAGAVSIDLSPYAPNTELAPQIIKVGAAQEREIYGITYLGLPAGRSSSLKLKFEVPANYSERPLTFKLRMQCIASSAYTEETTYASATVSYYKVARATTPKDLENLEQGASVIPCEFNKIVQPHTMFEVESSEIQLNAGDTVIVIISRDNSSSYNADLAIARIHGILNILGGTSAA